MLKGSMWAEMLYFAFYTETTGTVPHLSLKGNSPVQFQSGDIKPWPLNQYTTGKWGEELFKYSAFKYNVSATTSYHLSGKEGAPIFSPIRPVSALTRGSSGSYLSDIKYLRGLFPFQLLSLFIFSSYKAELWWPTLFSHLPPTYVFWIY